MSSPQIEPSPTRGAASPSQDPSTAAEWSWEQDAQLRYTRITPPPGDRRIDTTAYVGRTRWELPGSRPLSESWAAHRARLDRHEPFSGFEHFVFPEDGTPPRYFSSSGEPRFDERGRFTGYAGITRDITEEVGRRLEVSGVQGWLRLAAQLGRFGAWSSDLRRGITTWSLELQGLHEIPWGRECPTEQMLELYAPEWRASLATAFAECARNGTPFDLELQILDAGQQRVWVRVIGVAMRDPDGTIATIQGAYQDIQKSKEISESNRAWASRLRTTLDSLSDGFAIIGRDWRVSYANRTAAAMFHLTVEQAVGSDYWSLFPGVRETVFGERYIAAMEHRESFRFEEYYGPLDMWFRISVFPVEEGIAISFSDVSAQRREHALLVELNEELERRVRERTEQLEAVNADLKAFSYSVAHDLRAPIGRIAGFADALEHSTGPTLGQRGSHYLARIRASARDMEAMTSGLITLFRVAHGSFELVAVDLAKIAGGCVARLRHDGQALAADIRIDATMRATADPTLMAILYDNLVGNACKYTRGQPHPEIHVGCRAEGGTRTYYVRDNGVGFDSRSAKRLFQPFTRLHGAEYEGSGIGLATVHKIVSLHGGRVWAESAVGEGATIFFTLA